MKGGLRPLKRRANSEQCLSSRPRHVFEPIPMVQMRQCIFRETATARFQSEADGLEDEEEQEQARKNATSSLAGLFAGVLLFTDVSVKVLYGLLQGGFLPAEFSPFFFSRGAVLAIFALFMVLSLLVLGFCVRSPISNSELRLASQPSTSTMCDQIRAAIALWPHREIWCLSITNLLFGLGTGYMNGVVNGSFAARSPTFGKASVGYLMALTSLLAVGISLLLGPGAQRLGKGGCLGIGGLALGAIPLTVLVWRPSEANEFWGWRLVILYALQGLGRSVYESINRATFADRFPGPQRTGAFANCMMQSGGAFFISFLLQATLVPSTRDRVVTTLVVILSMLVLPCYLLAWSEAPSDKRSPLLQTTSETA